MHVLSLLQLLELLFCTLGPVLFCKVVPPAQVSFSGYRNFRLRPWVLVHVLQFFYMLLRHRLLIVSFIIYLFLLFICWILFF